MLKRFFNTFFAKTMVNMKRQGTFNYCCHCLNAKEKSIRNSGYISF